MPEGKAVGNLLIAIPVLLNFPKSLFTIHGVLRPPPTTIHSNPIHFICFSNPLHLQSTPPSILFFLPILGFSWVSHSANDSQEPCDHFYAKKKNRAPTFCSTMFTTFPKTYFLERKQAYLGRKSLYPGRKNLYLGKYLCI